ncbi:MAG TPA: M20 family metallopeptidase [Selenomonadales bacterium]|nr:M20 family metallopeptidase [Selenomonadales bacterium]
MLRFIADKEQEMTDFLRRLVSIDSGSDNPEGIAQVARIVGAKLQAIGFAVDYLDYPDICTHLKATKKGTTAEEVMIIGHMDTLFPKGTVAKRPFTVKDGKAYGPGVLDMKGGVTIALFALEALAAAGKNEKSVTVLFAGDEETAHPKTNAAELFEKEARGKKAVFNMETASVGDAVLIGRKGNLYAEMVVKGISAHAGADLDKGANAVTELAHKIIEIGKLTDFAQGLTFNAGVVEGGTVANAVPDRAVVKIDVRYLKNDDRLKAVDSLQAIANRQYIPGTTTELANVWEKFTPMEARDANKKLFEVVRAQGQKLGLDIEGKVGGGASDAGWTVRAGAPSICAMGAIGQFNHSDREYIYLDSLVKRAKLLALSIDAV